MDAILPKKRGRPRKRPLAEAQGGTNEKSGTEAKKYERVARPLAFLGRYVLKEFGGEGTFLGKIVDYQSGLYRVDYEDGDCEDLESRELRPVILDDNSFNVELDRRRRKLDKVVSAKILKSRNVALEEVNRSAASLPNELPAMEDNGDLIDKNVDGGSPNDSCDSEQEVLPRSDAEAPLLLPSPELPASSGNIGVPEESISHLLSVYGLLRSFSITLFLYPFGLDDFVGAVNCLLPNTLLDSVHVALMRVLKARLESLSSEGSEVASKCLRCIDWSLLDALTWPVYVFHYLTLMGHVNGEEWKGFYNNIFERDYYSLPVGRKLLILQVLCDDALDSAQLRDEVDVREETEEAIYSDGLSGNHLGNRPRRVNPSYSSTSASSNGATETIAKSLDMNSAPILISKGGGFESNKIVGGVVNNDQDVNGDECRLCGMDGILLCCDGCPSAYHSRCIGLVKTHVPEGSWYCPECSVDKIGPKINSGSSLLGAELFGTDPYAQVFMGTCNHLLVMVSLNGNQFCRYYNQKDIVKVLQALNSSIQHAAIYLEICKAIARYWDVPEGAFLIPQLMESQVNEKEGTLSSHLQQHASLGKESQSIGDVDAKNVTDSAGGTVLSSFAKNSLDQTMQNGDQTSFVTQIAELSGITNQYACDRPTMINHDPSSSHSCFPNGIHVPTIKFLHIKNNHDGRVGEGNRSSGGDCTYYQPLFKPQAYMNCYVHGYFAASAAANLATLLPEEDLVSEAHTPRNPKKAVSAISQQIKAFSSTASRFFWPGPERKLWEVPRERCGWCYTCKAPPSSRRGCMLNAAASFAIRGAMKFLNNHPIKNGERCLSSMATYISFIGKSFYGLISGPFLNENFRKKWHETVENGLSFSVLKALLLDLEEHIRPVAFSGDWVKQGDYCLAEGPDQSASHTAGSQKYGPSGRRNRKQSNLPEVAANGCPERSFTWWRGGKLSKFLFNKSILPSTMIKMAARQGGLKKIPAVHYVDGLEIPKRTRRVMWRAAVEMSKTVSQLAVQVRYVDLYLRWNDLVRPEPNFQDSKVAPEVEASVFRNAMVLDKKITGNKILYGVDFGAQKHLPSRVMKAIIDVEQGQDGKEKYWFSEANLPLYLIREYEESAKIPLPTTPPPNVLLRVQQLLLKGARMDIFSYLTLRRDNMGKLCCSSCGNDVPLRNVVICSKCQGNCHQECIIGSRNSVNKEVGFLFTCKQCYHIKAIPKIESTESLTSPLLSQTRTADEVPKLQTVNEIPKVKQKKKVTAKKSQEKEKKKKASSGSNSVPKPPRNNTWGIVWKKKHIKETGHDFRLEHVIPRGKDVLGLQPICKLCQKPYNPDLIYIRCKGCTYWYHADALLVEESRLSEVIGFKCCKCHRNRSPICPYDDRIKIEQPPSVTIKKEQPRHVESDSTDMRGWEPTTPLLSSEELVSKEDDPLHHCASSQFHQQFGDDSSRGTECESGYWPSHQKLPTRRQVNQETDDHTYFDATAPFEMDYPVDNNTVKASAPPPPPPMALDGASNGEEGVFDYNALNFEEMEFEPQTYFSFTELLAPEDGDGTVDACVDASVVKWENWDGGDDDLGFTISVDDPPVDVHCQVCSSSEPCPDLFCDLCGVWIHSHCSVRDKSEMESVGWRCGNCRQCM